MQISNQKTEIVELNKEQLSKLIYCIEFARLGTDNQNDPLLNELKMIMQSKYCDAIDRAG